MGSGNHERSHSIRDRATLKDGGGNDLPVLANVGFGSSGAPTLDINGQSTQIGSLSSSNSGAVVTNSAATAATLTVGNASSTTYSGLISSATAADLALSVIGPGALTLNGTAVNTYTGATKVLGGGLTLDMSNMASGYQNLINNGSALTLGGGLLTVKSNASASAGAVQTFNGTTFNAGASGVSFNNNSASGTTLALGAITARNAGSTVNFTLVSGGSISTTSTTFVSNNVVVSAASNGIAFATVGGNNWASFNGSNIIALAAGNQVSDIFTNTTGTANVNVTGADTASSNFDINTLNFTTNNASLAVNSAGTLNTGGILVGNGVSATLGGTAGLKPGAGKELVVIDNGTLALSASLADNGTSAVTYSGSGTTDLTGNSVGNSYAGATYLNQGTLKINANNQLGAVGSTNTIYINGGTLQFTGPVNLYNGTATTNPRAIAVGPAGATLAMGGNAVTISGVISSTLANAGLLSATGANSNLTLSGANTFTGGFSFGGGTLNLGAAAALGGAAPNFFTIAGPATIDNTTGSAVTLSNNFPMNWNANFTMVGAAPGGTHDISLGTGQVLLGNNVTVTVGAGGNVGTLTAGGPICDGGNGYSLTKNGGGTLVLSSALSSFSGGVTLNAGALNVGASNTDPMLGPLGTGTLTLSGGTIESNSSSNYTVNNPLAVNADMTVGALSTYTGTLTIDPSVLAPAGTITLSGSRTLTVFSGLTLNGPITGANGPSLTVKGPGTLTLNNGMAASTFGNLTIGDGALSRTLGGNVTAGNAGALGSGSVSVTVNFGGALNTTAAFNALQTFTVNNGGVLNFYSGAPAGLITLNSGAVVADNNSTLALTAGTTVSLPTTGALFNNATGGAIAVVGAYPSFTGDMSFGGSGSQARRHNNDEATKTPQLGHVRHPSVQESMLHQQTLQRLCLQSVHVRTHFARVKLNFHYTTVFLE